MDVRSRISMDTRIFQGYLPLLHPLMCCYFTHLFPSWTLCGHVFILVSTLYHSIMNIPTRKKHEYGYSGFTGLLGRSYLWVRRLRCLFREKTSKLIQVMYCRKGQYKCGMGLHSYGSDGPFHSASQPALAITLRHCLTLFTVPHTPVSKARGIGVLHSKSEEKDLHGQNGPDQTQAL